MVQVQNRLPAKMQLHWGLRGGGIQPVTLQFQFRALTACTSNVVAGRMNTSSSLIRLVMPAKCKEYYNEYLGLHSTILHISRVGLGPFTSYWIFSNL